MVEAGEVSNGFVPLQLFLQRFENMLAPFDAIGSKRGFQPFLHLAGGDERWQLRQGTRLADLAGVASPSGSSAFARHVDGALVRPDLLAFIQTAAGRELVRVAIGDRPADDRTSESEALLAIISDPDIELQADLKRSMRRA